MTPPDSAPEFICPPEFIALAHRLADAGGDVVRKYFRKSYEVEGKADRSPVTIADRECEQAMRDIIARERSDDGVAGEEFGQQHMDAEFVWVFDPIDGTKSFITGKPIFGILVSLLHRGAPVLGVIDQPILKERWVGGVGQPTTFNKQPCRTRPCAGLDHAVVNINAHFLLHGEEVDRAPFKKLDLACKATSTGGDCYAFGLLANGFIDLIIEDDLDLDDFAALAPVVNNAGGIMSDWNGQPLNMNSNGNVLAAGDRRVWEQALALMKIGKP